MVKWIKAAVVMIALLASPAAFAQDQGARAQRFSTEPRLITDEFLFVRNATASDGSAGLASALESEFVNGLLMAASFNAQTKITRTTSIGAYWYPTRLRIRLHDGNNDDTLSCGSGNYTYIEGYDQFGNKIGETLTTGLSETAQTTAKVYARVTKFNAYCRNNSILGDSSDLVTMNADGRIAGLPRRISSKNDIVSICMFQGKVTSNTVGLTLPAEYAGATTGWDCTTGANLTSLATTTVLSAYDAIDLTKIGLGVDTTYGPLTHSRVRISYFSD